MVEFNPEQKFGLNKLEMHLAVNGIERLMGFAGEDTATVIAYQEALTSNPHSPRETAFRQLWSSYAKPWISELTPHRFWFSAEIAGAVRDAVAEEVRHLDEHPLAETIPGYAARNKEIGDTAVRQLSDFLTVTHSPPIHSVTA